MPKISNFFPLNSTFARNFIDQIFLKKKKYWSFQDSWFPRKSGASQSAILLALPYILAKSSDRFIGSDSFLEKEIKKKN